MCRTLLGIRQVSTKYLRRVDDGESPTKVDRAFAKDAWVERGEARSSEMTLGGPRRTAEGRERNARNSGSKGGKTSSLQEYVL